LLLNARPDLPAICPVSVSFAAGESRRLADDTCRCHGASIYTQPRRPSASPPFLFRRVDDFRRFSKGPCFSRLARVPRVGEVTPAAARSTFVVAAPRSRASAFFVCARPTTIRARRCCGYRRACPKYHRRLSSIFPDSCLAPVFCRTVTVCANAKPLLDLVTLRQCRCFLPKPHHVPKSTCYC